MRRRNWREGEEEERTEKRKNTEKTTDRTSISITNKKVLA